MFRLAKRLTGSRRLSPLIAAVGIPFVLVFALLARAHADAHQQAESAARMDHVEPCPPVGYEPLTHYGLGVCLRAGRD